VCSVVKLILVCFGLGFSAPCICVCDSMHVYACRFVWMLNLCGYWLFMMNFGLCICVVRFLCGSIQGWVPDGNRVPVT